MTHALAQMTHYIPAYAPRLGIREKAICGAYVLSDRHVLEPTCPACRALIAAEDEPAPTVSIAEVVERY